MTAGPSSTWVGDQMGTLLACAYALYSEDTVHADDALAWIQANSWSDHVDEAREADHARCKRVLMQHQVRVENDNYGTTARTIGELVAIAAGSSEDAIPSETAAKVLGRIGLRVQEGGLLIHNNLDAIAEIYRDLPWPANWNRMLKRLDPSAEHLEKTYFSPGIKGRCLRLPLIALDI